MRVISACLFVSVLIVGLGCGDEAAPELDVPETYSFDPQDYSGQTIRLNMLEEMATYLKTSHGGAVLDGDKLKAMFANDGSPFSDSGLNNSGKQLRDKCFSLDQGYFEGWMDVAAISSATGLPASDGQAGTGTSGTSTYLFDENGKEPLQLIEKGLMGAVFYYQSVAVYLGEEEMNADNSTVIPGQGTAMEHHWDEAFGYTAFPPDFISPYPESGLRFWARYCNGRDPVIGCNQPLSLAFRTGRSAIGAQDYSIRDEQIAFIRQRWEEVCAATALHYLNEAIAAIGDDVVRNHTLSEALAFGLNLKYNPERRISLEQLVQFETLLGDNFYQISLDDIRSARDLIAGIYQLEEVAEIL